MVAKFGDFVFEGVKKVRKHYFNIEKFLDFTNAETQYWLGFIYADGYISKYFIRLYLSEQDSEHLKKFINFAELNDMIRFEKPKNRFSQKRACWVKINSVQLINSLYAKGYDKYNFTLPDILLYSPHFWRGFIDGDGTFCFSLNKRKKNGKIYKAGIFQIIIYGYEPILQMFKTFAMSYIPDIKIQIYYRNDRNYPPNFKEAHTSNKKAFLLAKILYNKASIFLERKKQIFDKAICYSEHSNWFANRLKR